MRAKTIKYAQLADAGNSIAKFLEAKVGNDMGEGAIGYFPDHGIFGGERPLKAAMSMKPQELSELSASIASEFLSSFHDVKPKVAVIDDRLIFGGHFGPDIMFEA